MIVIEESKDPNTFSLDELVGSFLNHKMKLKQGDDSNKKAQKANKKVGVALNSTVITVSRSTWNDKNQKQWSRHQSFLFRCDWTPKVLSFCKN